MTETRRFSGGRILTGQRIVESLVVEEGRVVLAGSEREARAASPTGTEVVPLGGRLVVPGLIDAHLHLAEMTRTREGLDLRPVRSIREMAERLESWAATHPSGPVVGRGWSVEGWPEGRDPTARDLDPVVADRPVILYHASGHAAVLNSAALEATGFIGAVPDPEGGRLGRNSDGSLDGRVYERALAPVGRLAAGSDPLPPGAFLRTLKIANSMGLTSVASMNTTPEELEALRAACPPEAPALRIFCYGREARWNDFDPADRAGLRSTAGVTLIGMKAFADGAFGPRTAWLAEPYTDRPGESGVPVMRGPELGAFLRRCREEGLAPAVHAIGDRALDEVLRALETSDTSGRRPVRVEHAGLVPPTLFSRLDRLRPALVVQPGFVWSDSWLGARLGPDRARWAYPFRSLLIRGHRLAGSSDAPFDSPDPWSGFAAALHRTSPDGGSANPTADEALSAPEALDLYTRNAAVAMGEPDLGALEAGCRADLVITGAPDLDAAVAVGAGTVRSTWVGGRCVFDRSRVRDP